MSRKQTIENFLDGITSTELEKYIKEHNLINKDKLENLKLLKRNRPITHFTTLSQGIYNDFEKVFNKFYKLGQAQIIGLLLNQFYDDKYTISDIKLFFKEIMKDDDTLREFIYEYMKDLK